MSTKLKPTLTTPPTPTPSTPTLSTAASQPLGQALTTWQELLALPCSPERFNTWRDAQYTPLVVGHTPRYPQPDAFQIEEDPDALYLRVCFPLPEHEQLAHQPTFGAGAAGELPTGWTITVPRGTHIFITPPSYYAQRGVQFVNWLLEPGHHPIYLVFHTTTQALTLHQGMPLVRLTIWK